MEKRNNWALEKGDTYWNTWIRRCKKGMLTIVYYVFLCKSKRKVRINLSSKQVNGKMEKCRWKNFFYFLWI